MNIYETPVDSRLFFVKEVAPYISPGGFRSRRGLYICDCETEIELIIAHAISGKRKSCGCISREIKIINSHPLRSVWLGIKNRTEDWTNKNYGARGVRMSKEFYFSFEVFRDYCLEFGWKEGLSIDRIDNNGDYERGNLRAADRFIQARNTRRSKIWSVKGKTFDSASMAADYFNVSRQTISDWCKNSKKSDCSSSPRY